MYKIGDLCPLFFSARKYVYERSLAYRQVFHTSDRILVEVISTGEVPVFTLRDLVAGTSVTIPHTTYEVNEETTLHYIRDCISSESVYSLSIAIGGDVLDSEEFDVRGDEWLLETTKLIKYSHSSNMSCFDEAFWAGDTELVHQFRVECGFKSGGFQPKLEAEAFRTQRQESRLLYAMPYTVETLTFGTAQGLPVWYAGFINRVFCLDRVSIDGEQVTRSGAAEVKLENVLDGGQQYVMSLDVEKGAGVSGIGGLRQDGTAPAVVSSGVAFRLSENIADGSVLQYSGNESAFVDTIRLE